MQLATLAASATQASRFQLDWKWRSTVFVTAPPGWRRRAMIAQDSPAPVAASGRNRARRGRSYTTEPAAVLVMKVVVLLLLAAVAGVAYAEDPTSRALLLRQQQSDAFSLQLQQ